MNSNASLRVFISVIIMEILVGAEVDLFVPSFPELQKIFNLTPFMVEMTLSVNLIAYCITSLFAGSFGDRYGRKPVLIWSLLCFIAGSVLCVIANSFPILLVGRFMQGVGIAGPAVLGYVVIADIYSAERQQYMMGVINGTISFAMAFAPIVGSHISLFFGWRGNFVALLVLGIISLILCIIFIPAGKANHNNSLSLREYSVVLTSKKAMLYILAICLLVTPFWLFISISPILYMGDLGVSLENFGYYQGAMCLLFSSISVTSSWWQRRFTIKKCFQFSIAMMVIFIIACTALIAFKIQDPLIITFVMLLLAVSVIFPINLLYPVCLETVKDSKGKISAVFVALRMIATALAIQIVSYFYTGTFLTLGIAMALILIAFIVCLVHLNKHDEIFVTAAEQNA